MTMDFEDFVIIVGIILAIIGAITYYIPTKKKED